MQTGRKGWHRRVDREVTGVKRKAELTDEINIDTSGHAYDQIEAQAKKTSLRDTSKVVYMGDAAPGINHTLRFVHPPNLVCLSIIGRIGAFGTVCLLG